MSRWEGPGGALAVHAQEAFTPADVVVLELAAAAMAARYDRPSGERTGTQASWGSGTVIA